MKRSTCVLAALVSVFAASARPAASGPADVVPAMSRDLSLGDKWYPLETQNGTVFRWVDRDAEIVIRHPGKPYDVLNLTVEAGPGLQTTQFPLIVKDSRNDQVSGVFVRGRETVHLVVPVDPNGDNRFTLAALGGGRQVGSDKRILNFRVFALNDGRSAGVAATGGADIVGDGVRIGGHGWYPLESFAGQTFRWVGNDAAFSVKWPHDQSTQIRVIAESGPGLAASTFTLHLRDGSGRELSSSKLRGRAIANLNVNLHGGSNAFKLHVDGGGHKAPNDPRTLNFRVFALSALQ